MKKIVFVIALVSIALVSCNKKEGAQGLNETTDSTKVDSAVVDSAVVDSAVVVDSVKVEEVK